VGGGGVGVGGGAGLSPPQGHCCSSPPAHSQSLSHLNLAKAQWNALSSRPLPPPSTHFPCVPCPAPPARRTAATSPALDQVEKETSVNGTVVATTVVTARLHSVGASLRWDDWPSGLPPYEMPISRRPPAAFRYPPPPHSSWRNYYYIQAQVDTTFAM
jgi:hypothetical protein